ncbi:MAG TPA: hypothetical protein VHB21_19455 [Minicystis sp.]|nr:hypothetical protein [Minicystis sp.]
MAEIVDRGLYADGGYDTAEAFLRAVVEMPARSAARMMRVARYASPAEEARYGVAVLDAALGYVEALTGGPARGKLPVAFARLKFPAVRNGKRVKVGLEAATVVDIRKATRALRQKEGGGVKRAPEEAALLAALAKDARLAAIEARVVAGSLRLGAVPLGLVDALAKALARAKLGA